MTESAYQDVLSTDKVKQFREAVNAALDTLYGRVEARVREWPVATEAALASLTDANVGDFAHRPDGTSYRLIASPPTIESNWSRLPTVADVGELIDLSGYAVNDQVVHLAGSEHITGTKNFDHAQVDGVDVATTDDIPVPDTAVAHLNQSETFTGAKNFIGGVTKNGIPLATTADLSNASITGQYLGSASTFTGLPTTDALGAPASNGDWAVLTADVVGTGTTSSPQYSRGAYVYNGSTFSFAFNLTGTGVTWGDRLTQTSSFSADVGHRYVLDATSANIVMQLPTAPADLSAVSFKLGTVAGGHKATLNTGGSDKFDTSGGPTSFDIIVPGQTVNLIYDAAAGVWSLQSSYLALSALDARYRNGMVFNVADYGVVLGTNTDAAGAANLAALIAAMNACVAAGGGTVLLPVGDLYLGQSSGSVARALDLAVGQYSAGTVWLRGAGVDASLVRLGGKITSLSGALAGGQTYGNLLMSDFTLDDNNVKSTDFTSNGAFCTWTGDSSIDNVHFFRLKGINGENLRTNGSAKRLWFIVSPGNTNSGQLVAPTPDHHTVTNVTWEDVHCQGGNYFINGQSFAASQGSQSTYVAARRNGYFIPLSDVYFDQIYVRNFSWSGNAPLNSATTGGDSSGIMFGQAAYGGTLVIENGSLANSADDLIEINSFTNATVRNVSLTNAKYEKLLLKNLGNIADPDQQSILLDNVQFFDTAGTPTPDIVISGPQPHGHITIRSCQTYQNQTPLQFLSAVGSFRTLKVYDNVCTYGPNANLTATFNGANYGASVIVVAPHGGRGVISVHDNHFIYRHAHIGTGYSSVNFYANAVAISPSDHTVIAENNWVDANIKTTSSGATVRCVGVGPPYGLVDDLNISTSYIAEAGAGGWITNTAGVYTPASSTYVGQYIRRIATGSYDGTNFSCDWGPFNDVGAFVKGAPGAALTGFKLGTILKNVAMNTMIEGYVSDDGTNSTLHIDKIAPNPVTVTDGVTATDNTLSSASASFSLADVGRLVSGTGVSPETYIATYVDASHVTLSKPTTATATGVSITIARETRTQLASPVTLPSRLTASAYTWLRGLIQQNTLTFTIHTSQPTVTSSPITGGTITYTLTGADIGTYGDPTIGYAGFSWVPDDTTSKVDVFGTLGIGNASFSIEGNGYRRVAASTTNAVGFGISFAGRVNKLSIINNDWSKTGIASSTATSLDTTGAGASVLSMLYRLGNINPDGTIDSDALLKTETVNTQSSVSGTYALPDVSVATIHDLTATGNLTLTPPTAVGGKSIVVKVRQDGTGGRTLAITGVKWPGGTQPTGSTGASKVDKYVLDCTNATEGWEASLVGADFR